MADNKVKFGCLQGSFDGRDYTFVDALEKMNRQMGQYCQFVVLNDESLIHKDGTGEQRQEGDLNYPVQLYSPSEYQQYLKRNHRQYPEPFDVFVPLNYNLYQQVVLRLKEGGDVGKDEIGINLRLGPEFKKYSMKPGDWSAVEDQASGHMCAANAGVALLEYFERRAEGRHIDASRLFLHYVACKLMNLEPTSGTSVKGVVRALGRVGVTPEEFWPYNQEKLTTEPNPLCYALARDFRATSYFRVDHPDIDLGALITQIKLFVSAGLPVIFGFNVYDSIEQAKSRGKIPLPTFGEKYLGGHAAVVVGYDDEKIIENTNPLSNWDRERVFVNKSLNEGMKVEPFHRVEQGSKGEPIFIATKGSSNKQYTAARWDHQNNKYKAVHKRHQSAASASSTSTLAPQVIPSRLFIQLRAVGEEEDPSAEYEDDKVIDNFVTKGAFKIRNSWGSDWGDKGYGWLPYAYILQGYTFDWWSVLKFDWVNIEDFGFNRAGNEIVHNPFGQSSSVPPPR